MTLVALFASILKNLDAVRWFIQRFEATPTDRREALMREIDRAFVAARDGDPRPLADLINR